MKKLLACAVIGGLLALGCTPAPTTKPKTGPVTPKTGTGTPAPEVKEPKKDAPPKEAPPKEEPKKEEPKKDKEKKGG